MGRPAVIAACLSHGELPTIQRECEVSTRTISHFDLKLQQRGFHDIESSRRHRVLSFDLRHCNRLQARCSKDELSSSARVLLLPAVDLQ